MTVETVSARHFEIFLTMATSRNMAEAADKLGISQAAVSKSLKGLERDIGLTLFRLANGRLQPTPDAERLLPFVQRALAQLDRARAMAGALRGGNLGRITVGVAGPAVTRLLPAAIARFRADWPDVQIAIAAADAAALVAQVAGGEVDLGLGTPPMRDLDARAVGLCDLTDVCRPQLVAALPARHPLARQSMIRAADLVGETLIGLPAESTTTQLVNAMFHAAKLALPPAIVASNAVAVCALVQQGLGIGLLSPVVLGDGIFSAVVARPFRPRVTLRTCLYRPKLISAPPQVARFADCVIAAGRELQRGLPALMARQA